MKIRSKDFRVPHHKKIAIQTLADEREAILRVKEGI